MAITSKTLSLKRPLMPSCDRRAGLERRQFRYAYHLPERRFRLDRRGGGCPPVKLSLGAKGAHPEADFPGLRICKGIKAR